MTNMVNYNWKQIVFGIRDMMVEDGNIELFRISNVFINDIKRESSSCIIRDIEKEPKKSVLWISPIIGVPSLYSRVEFIPYGEYYSTSVILIRKQKELLTISDINVIKRIDVVSIIIDRWKTITNASIDDIRHLEYLQNKYSDNGINIRSIIVIMHEMGHAFNSYNNKREEMRKLGKSRLSYKELNYYYHKQPGESYADFVAIDTLNKHGEEILELILSNKTEEDINRYV